MLTQIYANVIKIEMSQNEHGKLIPSLKFLK